MQKETGNALETIQKSLAYPKKLFSPGGHLWRMVFDVDEEITAVGKGWLYDPIPTEQIKYGA